MRYTPTIHDQSDSCVTLTLNHARDRHDAQQREVKHRKEALERGKWSARGHHLVVRISHLGNYE